MVFPSDPEWQRDYARYVGGDGTRNVRFRTWNTEELMVRCCMKFMPWLRCIHILLARESQVQGWMRGLVGQPQGAGPEVRVVFHRQFISKELLPTFNSATIEVFMGKVPGLSERFIYSNDDMFPLSPMREEDFFRDGLPLQRFTEKPFPRNPNIFHNACMSGLNFVAAEFGQHFDSTQLRGGHSMAPILRSSCEHLWQYDPKGMTASCTRVRNSRNFYQYIYPLYQHFSGQYADGLVRQTYASTRQTISELREVLRKSQGIVCVNDNECVSDIGGYARAAREEIAARLAG